MLPELSPANAKYAWALRGREAPPKRAAGERVHDFCEVFDVFDEATVRAQAAR